MKTAVVRLSDILHKSGASCMSAARFCEGQCTKARPGHCSIWDAGDCTAPELIRTRRITIKVTDAAYWIAVRVLQGAGFATH